MLANSCQQHKLERQGREVVVEKENAREKEVREVVNCPAHK